ncbi:MAG TPA: DUF6488 family protein [Terriglobales bacterium]|nr:DUF6488 family protein [Terriglobales bacterium]
MTICRTLVALALAAMAGAGLAHAHPPKAGEAPHTHGPKKWPPDALAKDEVVARAKEERDRLITEKKLESAWQSAAEPGIEQKWFNGRPEWVVTFRHPAPKDKAKQALYIFLTPTGRFVAANHTGR